jgi:hypothetical protein
MSQEIGPVTLCHSMSLVVTLTEDCPPPLGLLDRRSTPQKQRIEVHTRDVSVITDGDRPSVYGSFTTWANSTSSIALLRHCVAVLLFWSATTWYIFASMLDQI